jgi:hypothetical protein
MRNVRFASEGNREAYKRSVVRFILMLFLLLMAGCADQEDLQFWFVDSLTKVFPDDSPGTAEISDPTFEAARNSHLSVQLALRAPRAVGDLYVDALALTGPGMPIESVDVRWVEYVVVTSNTEGTDAEELLREAPSLFPDAVMEDFPITVEKERTKSVWLTVAVPPNQKPGLYSGRLRLRQGKDELTVIPYQLKVYAARVPSPVPLYITNYFNLGDTHLQQFFGCSRYSEAWWSLISNMARFMGRYHQTSIPASPVSLVTADVQRGRLQYNFDNFIRFVETFQAAGVPGPIEGGNLMHRVRTRGATVMVSAWVMEEGVAVLRDVPFEDPVAQAFLNSFLPILAEKLREYGWEENYLQGILDEPNPLEQETFVRAADLVRRHLPGVRTIEPVSARQDLEFMEQTVDIWVPLLGSFDEKLHLFEQHVERGGDVWFYTCLSPRWAYPNRFIDFSLVKTRILHWINFKHDFSGFLHWGGNFWGPEPFLDTQPVINQGRTYLPPGDAYITYPNRGGRSLYSSIRLEQMREGIEDFGLLTELAKHDETRARELAEKMVRTFKDYVRDEQEFRAIHRELLEALSAMTQS